MVNLEVVPHSYSDAIALLAGWHQDRDDLGFAAYSFPDPEGEVVRLVEVSNLFPSVDAVRPIRFGRSADFPFPSAVALVSVRDWARILDGSLTLPEGWSLEDVQRVRLNDQE